MIANVAKIPIEHPNPRSDDAALDWGQLSLLFDQDMPEFIPDDSKAQEIAHEVEKENKNKEEIKEEEEVIETGLDQSMLLLLEYNDVIVPRRQTFQMLLGETGDDQEKKDEILSITNLTPQAFEKDVDENFHVDFIYTMANL